MDITRTKLKSRAKTVLASRYWYFFAALAIYNLLPMIISPSMNFMLYLPNFMYAPIAYVIVVSALIFTFAVSIFLINPLYTAICRFILKGSTEPDIRFSAIWDVLRDNYFNLVKASFMRDLFLVIWSLPYLAFICLAFVAEQLSGEMSVYVSIILLGMVLGIILFLYKTYSYSMVNYIMADRPETSWRDALSESKRLMHGKTFFAFKLELSFFGWNFLGLLSCGLGVYFVQPYIAATQAQFYLALSNELNYQI